MRTRLFVRGWSCSVSGLRSRRERVGSVGWVAGGTAQRRIRGTAPGGAYSNRCLLGAIISLSIDISPGVILLLSVYCTSVLLHQRKHPIYGPKYTQTVPFYNAKPVPSPVHLYKLNTSLLLNCCSPIPSGNLPLTCARALLITFLKFL